ncbi:hypothetical protein FHL15_007703 [Xylaria flabelliformis]|uniref:Uncharacterized protein n=1 Tax=Xylaria flabelliformis TaxID=2512241 RepID=A0A553HU41_9PEZI|nr:hypothetical protein FHL15_007703 [Xylaria flabelliformis]
MRLDDLDSTSTSSGIQGSLLTFTACHITPKSDIVVSLLQLSQNMPYSRLLVRRHFDDGTCNAIDDCAHSPLPSSSTSPSPAPHLPLLITVASPLPPSPATALLPPPRFPAKPVGLTEEAEINEEKEDESRLRSRQFLLGTSRVSAPSREVYKVSFAQQSSNGSRVAKRSDLFARRIDLNPRVKVDLDFTYFTDRVATYERKAAEKVKHKLKVYAGAAGRAVGDAGDEIQGSVRQSVGERFALLFLKMKADADASTSPSNQCRRRKIGVQGGDAGVEAGTSSPSITH